MTNPVSFPSATTGLTAAASAIRTSADPPPVSAAAGAPTEHTRSEVTATPQTHQEVQFDKSGLTVVMTYDVANGGLVAQYPAEAYLRLANAMQNLVRHEDVDGNGGRTA